MKPYIFWDVFLSAFFGGLSYFFPAALLALTFFFRGYRGFAFFIEVSVFFAVQGSSIGGNSGFQVGTGDFLFKGREGSLLVQLDKPLKVRGSVFAGLSTEYDVLEATGERCEFFFIGRSPIVDVSSH